MTGQALRIVPLKCDAANEMVRRFHRHHRPTNGGLFAIGVADVDGVVVGAAIVGRPVARHLDDGATVEVTRLVTNGHKNAASMLYSAAWRAARAMGYRRCVTYILISETGVSLRAAGWKLVGEAGGGTWNRPRSGRLRLDNHPTQTKLRWEAPQAA